ncbi:hypothetical protein DQ04_06081020 [Trypanosoma grayi]|uniref:hypothetical protein n=1 Tax=Trypanosoma grayi TaxID=71804 RepID=UPI0004F4056D|nr:hypothetical protein DQ04_06081020 [Trypanosoma grayi]KEG08965.1 hypothetical protein DQ04_06081020 [Trypanosoma grayi]
MDDVLLGRNAVRLPCQYDATSFLQLCPSNEQYRILASICRSESQCSSKLQPQHETVPDVYYASRLIAFSTGRGRRAGVLEVLRAQQQQQAREEERRLRLERQRQQEEVEAEHRQHVEEDEANQGGEQEVYYNEDEDYYYDDYGYYDADGNYYYFETTGDEEKAEGAEAPQTSETGHREGEQEEEQQQQQQQQQQAPPPMLADGCEEVQDDAEAEAEALWRSDDPFDEARHSAAGDGAGVAAPEEEGKEPTYVRVLPGESHWTDSPFIGGVFTLSRAAQHLEGSLPHVDAYLRDGGALPSLPVSVVDGSCEASKEDVALCPSSIHVLASRLSLHVVHVPPPRSKQEVVEEVDAVAALLNRPAQACVLMSIPLPHSFGSSCTASYSSLGNGYVLLEIYAAPARATGEPDDGVTLSMVFGIPPDASFRSVPLASRLVQCYERRVLQHLAQCGCVEDVALVMELWGSSGAAAAGGGGAYAEDSQKPLFSYSALLLSEASDTMNDAVGELVYDAASNSLLHCGEREYAERLAREREEAFYMARNMESPQRRYVREAVEALQLDEAHDRVTLDAEAMSMYRVGHFPSFPTVASVVLPFLQECEAGALQLREDEQRQWERLFRRFGERRQQLIADETRHRLEDQFRFERRLRLLQCSVGFDVLVEREAAARAVVERDEAFSRHGGDLLECCVALLACRRVEEIEQRAVATVANPLGEAEVETKRQLTHFTAVYASPVAGDALVRSPSPLEESPRHQRSSMRSTHSLTTEEFMRVVADGSRSAPSPSHLYAPRRVHLPTV